MEAGSENYQHCKFSRCRNPADIVGLAKPVTVVEIRCWHRLKTVHLETFIVNGTGFFVRRKCID